MEEMNNSGAAQVGKGSGMLLTAGWIAAIIAVFYYPFIFGVVGVITGILATRRGSRGGLALIVVSLLAIVAGLLFGGVLANYVTHFLGFQGRP